jgi:hypothetical protein
MEGTLFCEVLSQVRADLCAKTFSHKVTDARRKGNTLTTKVAKERVEIKKHQRSLSTDHSNVQIRGGSNNWCTDMLGHYDRKMAN